MSWCFVKESNGVPKVLRERDGINADVEADILRHQRGDLFDKRRRLMDAWAEFCRKNAAGAKILPLRKD